MSTSGVSGTSGVTTTGYGTTTKAQSALGKDTFLKLLVTQLQNQDPMKPMDDTTFVAQLAQFSSLEQMQSMSTGLESSSKSQSAIQAFSMIGRNINYTTTDSSTPISGTVDSVSFVDGAPKLNVGTTTVDVADVVKVY